MKPNSNPGLVVMCMLSHRVLSAHCGILAQVVTLFSVDLKRKKMQGRGEVRGTAAGTSYVRLSLELALEVQTRYKLKARRQHPSFGQSQKAQQDPVEGPGWYPG